MKRLALRLYFKARTYFDAVCSLQQSGLKPKAELAKPTEKQSNVCLIKANDSYMKSRFNGEKRRLNC